MIARLSQVACLTWAIALPVSAADRALLIGIDAYAEEPLRGAVNDVNAMERVAIQQLGFPPEGILVLRDHEATTRAIHQGIDEWLVKGTGSGDRVLLYFAGHGTQVKDGPNQDETDDGLDEAIVPVDYNKTEERLIRDDDLGVYLEELKDRRVTVIVDACNSGSVHRSMGGQSAPAQARYLPPLLTTSSRSAGGGHTPASMARDAGWLDGREGPLLEVWTATAPYQLTYDTYEDGAYHGVFTRAFVEALETGVADRDRNGRTSRNEVLAHVQDRAERFCLANTHKDVCNWRDGVPALTPSLAAPLATRALTVAAWPVSDGASQSPAQHPAPDPLADLEDIVVGGSVRANLVLEHAGERKRGALEAGDPFRLRINADVTGQLMVLWVKETGEHEMLFPDAEFQRDTHVTAGQPYLLPDALQGVEFRYPEGRGALIAVVTPERDQFRSLLAQSRSIAVVGPADPAGGLAGMMDRLTRAISDQAENRGIRFGVAVARYGRR